MSDDKPLRVQVAEAMGLRVMHLCDNKLCIMHPEEGHVSCPDYGGPDWAATGEMLEWLGRTAIRLRVEYSANHYSWIVHWESVTDNTDPHADTIHEAVARCVLAVAERGKS